MRRSCHFFVLATLAVFLSACQAPDDARALRVVTSGGFTAAYNILAPQFEDDTGIELTTAYGASAGGAPNSIPERLARGEKFDVLILSRSSLDNLTSNGYVKPGSRRDLVESTIGMAVKEGTNKPDISTPESFVQGLRDAESFGYSASASGTK